TAKQNQPLSLPRDVDKSCRILKSALSRRSSTGRERLDPYVQVCEARRWTCHGLGLLKCSRSWSTCHHGIHMNYVRKVTLKRSRSHEGLGFSIRGGSEHGVGIYVSLVEPGSSAQREGLRIGDQIVAANDMMFDNVTHVEAVKNRCSDAADGSIQLLSLCLCFLHASQKHSC
uniref:PDZ domain-containing protein n=1 Tax=Oryzias latipes TaxID=8090 RepID=A0A3P9IT71_ORYLA